MFLTLKLQVLWLLYILKAWRMKLLYHSVHHTNRCRVVVLIILPFTSGIIAKGKMLFRSSLYSDNYAETRPSRCEMVIREYNRVLVLRIVTEKKSCIVFTAAAAVVSSPSHRYPWNVNGEKKHNIILYRYAEQYAMTVWTVMGYAARPTSANRSR